MQALFPFAVGIGVRGDAAADAENSRPVDAELDCADRDVEFASGDG